MTLNFKSIMLTRNDVVITMNPVRFYIVTNHVVKYVILYEIVFRKVASEGVEGVELKTTIPYYVSNGITNKLRANLLYPFMCYSNMIDARVCPFNVNVEGNPFSSVLIKYNVVESIDINVVERKLLENFKSLARDPGFEASFVDQLTRIIERQSDRNDLVSVLKRLTNLVDFIICISCDSVQKFKPTQDEITAVKNGKYCSLLRTNLTDYTDLSIPGDEETYVVSRETGDTDNTLSRFNAYFRVAIMTTLNAYYQLFVGEGGLVVTDVRAPALPPNEVTVTELNTVLNVCNKEITQHNMEYYKRISIEMMKLFKDFGPGLIRSSVFVHETYQQMYDRLLPGYLCISISPESQIRTSDVSKLDEQEILSELASYSDFMKSQIITDKTGKSVSKTLKQGVDAFIEKTCPLEGHEKIKCLRKTLIDIRLRMMKDMYRTSKQAMVTGREGGRRLSRRRRTRKNKTKKSKKLKSKNKIM